MLTKQEKAQKLARRVQLAVSGKRRGRARAAFVFGAQRSGTDMVASVLNESPEVECYYESDLEAFQDFVLIGNERVSTLVARSRARVVLFKSILNSQNATTLLDLGTESRALWLFRPYEDVVNSNLKRFHGHFSELDEMIMDPVSAGWRVENVLSADMKLVEKYRDRKVSDASARALLWYLRNRQYFQQGLNHDARVLLANYDHIVTDRNESFERIFAHLNLTYRPRYARKVLTTSIRRDPTPELDPEIRQLCDAMFGELSSKQRI